LLDGAAVDRLRGPMAEPNSSQPGFWALIFTQFQGAFNDNALKWLVSYLVIGAGLSTAKRDFLFVLVVPLLFAVPFLLFSIPGGYLADRYSKREVAVGTKVFELCVMGFATVALAFGRLDLAGAALFFACTQGALFGPTKYGLLPEMLPYGRLSWGNGILELTTLLAAILGSLAGGLLAQGFRGRQVWSGVFLLVLSLAGFLSSRKISRLPAADPGRQFPWNWPKEFWQEWRRMRQHAELKMAVLANAFFWFLGALLLLNVVLYAADVLRVDEAHSSYLLAALGIGIGLGSVAAGFVSGRKIESGMILPGLLGVAVFCILLSWPGLTFGRTFVLLNFVGVCGGFFVVPVNAWIQQIPRPEEKGRVIAVANLLSFVGVGLQPVAQFALLRLGHPAPSRVFLIAGIGALAVVIGLAMRTPGLRVAALDWTRIRRGATL
jgi:acyl-[acyl-carrier-protein]-phospholipid O-acyltransferase / long-chain-fatty-acid--[acyl-carrier-protein] ligase